MFHLSLRRIALAGALLVVASACTSDTSETTTTSFPLTSTSSTTTTAPTTTAPTTTLATTTTVTTTTTTTTPATTTVPALVFGFFVDGYGVVDFGASPDEVIAALTPIMGPPSGDTGWLAEPICPGTQFRAIKWGPEQFDFRALFTDANFFAPAGVAQFFTYNYHGVTPVPVTPPALTVGTTVGQLKALYPSVVFSPNPFLAGVTDYLVAGSTPYEQLYGQVSGTNPADVVESVQGGVGCGE
ncbi:MAG: hypothetical protein R2823_06535 [Acidimicrobiia bacterium]